MSKEYTASKVEGLVLKIKFATPSDPVIKFNTTNPENPVIEHHAAVMILHCVAKNGTMVAPCDVEKRYLGASKNRPWTIQEVANALKNFNNMNTAIFNDVRALYLDAISVVIT